MIFENINQFSYNGKRSYDDMGLIITEAPAFSIPERDVDIISIPGRSGDLIKDNGRYKNITGSYKIAIIEDGRGFELQSRNIAAWLAGSVGYCRLSDTYTPNYYRLAAVTGAISVSERLHKIGTATVKFNCKPYKYRIDGDTPIIISTATAIFNPEAVESVPNIVITGSGNITLTINNASFAFEKIDGYIEVDGDIGAAFKGNELQNNKSLFSEFPTLAPGWNNISFTGAVEKIEVKPRWRAL